MQDFLHQVFVKINKQRIELHSGDKSRQEVLRGGQIELGLTSKQQLIYLFHDNNRIENVLQGHWKIKNNNAGYL